MTITVKTSFGTPVRFPDDIDPAVIQQQMVLANQAEARQKTQQRFTPGGPGAPPIPQPIQNIQRGPDPLQDLAKGGRPAAIMGGAIAGAEVGAKGGAAIGTAALGPGPGTAIGTAIGGVAGGALGAAGGSFAFDSFADFVKVFGGPTLPGQTAAPAGATELERMMLRGRRAGREAFEDAAFAGGAALVSKAAGDLMRIGLGKVMGARTDQAREMTNLAKAQGVHLGAVDVGNFAPKAFARVAGVFPFTGTPALRGMTAKRAQVETRINETLDLMAPTETMANEFAIDAFKAAQNASNEFKRISTRLYEPVKFNLRNIRAAPTPEQVAQGLPGDPLPIIPTGTFRGTLVRHLEQARLREVPSRQGGTLPQASDTMRQWLKDHIDVVDELTYDQWDGLNREMKKLFENKSLTSDDFRILSELKQAHKIDLGRIGEIGEDILRRVAPDAFSVEANLPLLRAAVKAKTDADQWFAGAILPFQTTTAKKFGQADPNIFKVGPEGSGRINVDELTKSVFNADSQLALQDLRALVGEDVFRRGARNHLQEAFNKSFRTERRTEGNIDVLDLELWANNLGLGPKSKTTGKRAALEEMLKGTPTTVRDLEDLIENARITKINDPAQFVTRRVTLGGLAALGAIAGFGGGLMGQVGLTGAALGTLMTRHFSKIIADPDKLKLLQQSFAPDIDAVLRRQNVFRLARALGETFDPISTPGPIQQNIQQFLDAEEQPGVQ